MAAFVDALDLRTAVVELVKNATIVDVFGRLLIMAEMRINREARHRKMIASATLTFTDGEATLPTDFIEPLHLYGESNAELVQAPLTMVKDPWSQWRYYAIDGSNVLVYGFNGTKTFEYWSKIPTLTSSLTDTNWVLTDYPDVYLYTTATEAAGYLQNAEMASAYDNAAMRALDAMKLETDRARWSRAVVVPRGVNP
jgi:hypothetical protein